MQAAVVCLSKTEEPTTTKAQQEMEESIEAKVVQKLKKLYNDYITILPPGDRFKLAFHTGRSKRFPYITIFSND